MFQPAVDMPSTGGSMCPVHHAAFVYAQHGHELMGCKSPAGKPVLFQHEAILTASEWQVQLCEDLCEGSRTQNCEPMDKNVI